MDHFAYRNGELWCDEAPARELAERHGTPLYVYCARTIRHHFAVLEAAFGGARPQPLICYSVKANSNLAVLRLLAELGAGFDVVSGGELQRVLEAGGRPERIVYAGVGKTESEIDAAMAAGIFLFNVESEPELARISASATRHRRVAAVALRVNPDVDPRTHRYITTGKRENKFGVDLEQAAGVLARAAEFRNLEVAGLHVHLGSQITEVAPYAQAIAKVLEFASSLRPRPPLRWLDIGGGFGAHYRAHEGLPPQAFAEAILPLVASSGLGLILEPGRLILANAGVLLTRIVTLKESGGRRFAICDAGMNDLIRPSLYQAYHRIWPVRSANRPATEEDATGDVDIVGPICESADFLGRDRRLPTDVRAGDVLAVFTTGAYGFSMASNYNTRGRAAEVMVDGADARVIRRRESYEDQVRLERAP
ncbi:MAG: diaminopimelate decarboxylase [Planctomycetota bacterium]